MGSALYSIGGFPLPFLCVGTLSLFVAIALIFTIPDVQATIRNSSDDDSNVLNVRAIAKVIRFTIWFLQDDKYINLEYLYKLSR